MADNPQYVKFKKIIGSTGKKNGQFKIPKGLCVDAESNIYIADCGNNRIQIISKITGKNRRSPPCKKINDFLYDVVPSLIAVSDRKNMLFVFDCREDKILIYNKENNKFIETFKQYVKNIPIYAKNPMKAMIADCNGNIYITDYSGNRVIVYNEHQEIKDVIGGTGYGNSNFIFHRPSGLAFDTKLKLLYVDDTGHSRIQVFKARGDDKTESCGYTYVKTISYDKEIIFRENKIIEGYINTTNESSLAVDQSNGNIFRCDKFENKITIFNSNGQLIYSFGSKGNGECEFSFPSAIAIDGNDGDIVISDSGNDRIVIYQNLLFTQSN